MDWWVTLPRFLALLFSAGGGERTQDKMSCYALGARLPGSGICEIAVNSALALIEAVAPKDELEGALALQMACTHIAAMVYWPDLRVCLPGSGGQRCFRLLQPN